MSPVISLGKKPGAIAFAPNLPSCPLGSQLSRQADNGTFACGVGSLRHLTDPDQPKDRGDVHNRPTRGIKHGLCDQLRQPEGGDEVQLQDSPKVRDRLVFRRGDLADPRPCTEAHRQAGSRRGGRPDEALLVCVIGEIAPDGNYRC